MSLRIKLDGAIRDCHRVPSCGHRLTDTSRRAYDDLAPNVVGPLDPEGQACQIPTRRC